MVRVLKTQSVQSIGDILGNDIAEAITGVKVQTGGIAGIYGLFVKNYLLKIFATHSTMQLLYD